MVSRSENDGLAAITENDLLVLSIGISTGGAAEIRMLRSNPKRHIIATTLDEDGIESVREKVRRMGLSNHIELRLEDISAENLAYEDEMFDFVYARLVLHYLSAQKLETALGSLHRIIKPGGKLFVVVRSTDSPELQESPHVSYDETTCLTTYQSPSGTFATRYFHTVESISAALETNGFRLEAISKFDEKLSPDFERNSGIWVLNNVIEVLAKKN